MRSVLANIARPALRSSRTFSSVALRQPVTVTAVARKQQWQPMRFASSAALSKSDIEARIVDILKSFEKVDPSKVTASSNFTADLGLDSLDAVEVVMAIEEEFSIEIPDEEADAISTVAQAIDYISKTPEAH